jgi:polysaccharide export outer membrane protein
MWGIAHREIEKSNLRLIGLFVLLGFFLLGFFSAAAAQSPSPSQESTSPAQPRPARETTDDYNRRLVELQKNLAGVPGSAGIEDYRIGPEDLLEISVFEAPELNRALRVSQGGEISMPILGAVDAAGNTPREMEKTLQNRLRGRYLVDPHVSVYVKEMESHPVSVLGAVKMPGVFRIRGAKSLLEILSMAQGLAPDAGDTVIVMRGGGFTSPAGRPLDSPDGSALRPTAGPASLRTASDAASSAEATTEHSVEKKDADPAIDSTHQQTAEINLKSLLESGDPQYNVPVFPGDIVKVTRAGIVYVVGEVKRPGGFVLKSNENISVLQAVALAEGLTRTSASSRAKIIRSDPVTGTRHEIPINLSKVLASKLPDTLLQPNDIVFVPNSSARSALYRSAEAAISVGTGLVIYRR